MPVPVLIAVLWRSLNSNPALYVLSRTLSDPKVELEKKEYMQHNPCHIFVTRMLTQKQNKSQYSKLTGSCQESPRHLLLLVAYVGQPYLDVR